MVKYVGYMVCVKVSSLEYGAGAVPGLPFRIGLIFDCETSRRANHLIKYTKEFETDGKKLLLLI